MASVLFANAGMPVIDFGGVAVSNYPEASAA
jgi:hypothetical protein